MSQNRKSNRKDNQGKRGGFARTLISLFIGLAIGALVAAGGAWYIARTNPFKTTEPATAHQPVDNQVKALPGKPGDEPVQSDEEFFRVLAGSNAPTPGAGQQPRTNVPRTPSTPPEQVAVAGEALFLQVGAFANPDEAENLKVQLAFSGIQSEITQGLTPNGRSTLYRVRVGPVFRPQDVALVRSRLNEAGFKSTLTRADP